MIESKQDEAINDNKKLFTLEIIQKKVPKQNMKLKQKTKKTKSSNMLSFNTKQFAV